uniref:CRF domain-containing protein n=1 Tax=Rhabditophanes sp. KR3021 TaxID=114890 RepID=A0AC35TQ18_9BILA
MFSKSVNFLIFVTTVLFVTVSAAPAYNARAQLELLEDQIAQIKYQLNQSTDQNLPLVVEDGNDYERSNGRSTRQLAWQPMKRSLAWQPMKRSLDSSKVQLITGLENRLMEVLSAGKELGVSNEDIINHLKSRNFNK